jgi:DNA invertase Pin-like site-specific DNA recombinase
MVTVARCNRQILGRCIEKSALVNGGLPPYARVSTVEQDAGFEAQERDLKAAGVERLNSERTSAVGPRRALEEAIDFAREGDALVVTKLDRLARSVADLVGIVERLTKKGVGLRILAMGVDTATPTGKLVLNVLGAIGQF